MTYYETLDDLPLYSWDKFISQNNDNWFLVGFDGRQPIVKDEKLIELAIQLKKFGYKIPEINTYEGDVEEINNIINGLDGLVTQINIMNDDLKTEATTSNLTKELISVSIGLELGYRIDPKVTSVREWLEMINLLKEKSERLKNN